MTNDIYPKVLVCVPSMGNPSFKTMQSLTTFAATKNFKCLFYYPESTVIHMARNSAVKIALQNECSHVMFIDDDMVFDADAVGRLLIQDKDIIGALCFGRTEEMVKPIVKKIVDKEIVDYSWDEVKNWKETTKVASTGTGFLLIKTDVLNRMTPPFFYFGLPEEFGLKPLPPPNTDMSEDTTFMMRATELGYDIFVDPTIIIGHHGGKVYQRPLVVPLGTIAIVIPTMGRFERLLPMVENIRLTSYAKHDIYFITNEPEVKEMFSGVDGVFVKDYGSDCISYAKRINTLFDSTHYDYYFSGSNDIEFKQDWDRELLKTLSIPSIGIVAANDLFNPSGTNFMISREYIEKHGGTFTGEKGKIFFEYNHNFCDTELVAKARVMNAYKFCEKAIVEHYHPLAKKSEDDWVYRKGREKYEEDQRTFQQRYKDFTTKLYS